MRTHMWLEGIGEAFLIKDFVFGSTNGFNAKSGSYGLCKFDGNCIGDFDVTKTTDWISSKLLSAAASGKNFPTGKISAIYGNEYGSKYATLSIYLLNVRVAATVVEKNSDEKISFICSNIMFDYGDTTFQHG